MKLRNPRLIRAIGNLGSRVIRLWLGSLRFKYQPLGPHLDPRDFDRTRQRFIYTFWHENMLLPAYLYGHTGVYILISQHADGELITAVAQRLGIHVVRGSTTRGGVDALRQMLTFGKDFHLAITPDGPRGPRRQVQLGLIYLAARLGLPIVPAGFGFERPWRAKSWDRFAIPRPGTRATCVTSEPVIVPTKIRRESLETYRQLVESQLHHLTGIAEHWAESNRLHFPARLRAATVRKGDGPLPDGRGTAERSGLSIAG